MRQVDSLFRYPGGKGKLNQQIAGSLLRFMIRHTEYEYREPFFGSGAIGLILLRQNYFENAWINDKDYGIASIWNAIFLEPDKLCDKLKEFKPTPAAFFSFKNKLRHKDLRLHDFVEVGFMKLAIHQISFSGLGTMAGGPLGGTKQISKYKVDCRWNPEALIGKVRWVHSTILPSLREGFCSYDDFQVPIQHPGDAIIYLDPPYYEKGPTLYQQSFTREDHWRLRDLLKESEHPWLLSYDSCEEVQRLYEDWAECKVVDINYTINKSRRRTELLIAPKDHAYLLICDADPPSMF